MVGRDEFRVVQLACRIATDGCPESGFEERLRFAQPVIGSLAASDRLPPPGRLPLRWLPRSPTDGYFCGGMATKRDRHGRGRSGRHQLVGRCGPVPAAFVHGSGPTCTI